jgi:phosphohistidine phosphatase
MWVGESLRYAFATRRCVTQLCHAFGEIMDLILWRHAEAVDGYPDHDRALTPKGRKQAVAVGAWLARRLPDDARILVSPAVRAQQTAAGLQRHFKTLTEIAPGCAAAAVLAAAGWPDGRGVVLVVGHQPTLGEVASLLLCGQAPGLALKKGGLVWLSGRSREGGPPVVLKAAITADLV